MPTLDVVIDADTRGLNSGMDDAEKRFGGMGGIAKGAGLAIAGGLAIGGAAAVKFGIDAIGAASDLNETLNKSRVIFGQHADEVEEWSNTSATAFGLSKAAALDAASGLGNMFSQLGQGKAEAAKTSEGVVQLAADLGSFNNLETGDVLDRITAAFRGEYDSLQALIPNINAARVEKEALAATGKETADSLTAEEKAMAALAIVQKDGAAAQGDFAETSDGLANQQKILAARFEDVKASLGDKLLPIATQAVSTINDLFSGQSELGDGLKKHLGPILEAQGEILEDVIEIAKDLYHWFIDEIAPGLIKTVEPVLEAIGDGFDTVHDAIEDNEPQLRDLLNILKEVAEFIAQQVLPIVGDLVGEGFELMFDSLAVGIDVVAGLVEFLEDLWNTLVDIKNAIESIDFPDIPDIPGIPFPGRSAFGGGRPPVGDGGSGGPALIQITVQGAVDPQSTARQIRQLLSDADAVNGLPDWSDIA